MITHTEREIYQVKVGIGRRRLRALKPITDGNLDPDGVGPHGVTSLGRSSFCLWPPGVQILLLAGANPNKVGSELTACTPGLAAVHAMLNWLECDEESAVEHLPDFVAVCQQLQTLGAELRAPPALRISQKFTKPCEVCGSRSCESMRCGKLACATALSEVFDGEVMTLLV